MMPDHLVASEMPVLTHGYSLRYHRGCRGRNCRTGTITLFQGSVMRAKVALNQPGKQEWALFLRLFEEADLPVGDLEAAKYGYLVMGRFEGENAITPAQLLETTC